MNRKEFIQTCGGACIGLLGLSILSSGCSAAKMVNAVIEEDYLLLPLSTFEKVKEADEKQYFSYLVAQNSELSYPVYVYRIDENNYSALLMRCTHQGTELQAFGDRLQCPAHGSIFSNNGTVNNGPATNNLRTFRVSIANSQLKISLK